MEIRLQIREGCFAVLTLVAELHFETQVCYGSFSVGRVNEVLSLVHLNLLKFIRSDKIYVTKCAGSYASDTRGIVVVMVSPGHLSASDQPLVLILRLLAHMRLLEVYAVLGRLLCIFLVHASLLLGLGSITMKI